MGLTAPLVTGAGAPVTVVAHGLGGSPAETRPLVGAVPGTRVFPTARAGVPGEPYDYALLGADLLEVADAAGATQAVGVSLGAGALLSLLAGRPDRFARVVLLLPAALDQPRLPGRLGALADALDAGSAADVAACVREEVPADLREVPGVPAYLAARTAHLLASPGLAVAVRSLPAAVPVRDRALLGAVTADVLVVGQEGDPLHPAQTARDVAAALPSARLVVFDQPGAAIRERRRLRALVGEWLS